MSDNAIESVTAIFTRVVGAAPVRGADTLPRDMSGWDSLTHVKFVHALELHFDCELPDDFLLPGKALRDFAAVLGRN